MSAVVLYDLSYLQQSREEMELLITLLTERYERNKRADHLKGSRDCCPEAQSD